MRWGIQNGLSKRWLSDEKDIHGYPRWQEDAARAKSWGSQDDALRALDDSFFGAVKVAPLPFVYVPAPTGGGGSIAVAA